MAEITEKKIDWTKQDIQDFLDEISKQVVEGSSAHVHAMLGLNRLMSLPNVKEIFSDDLKLQAKDIWIKIKSTGLQLEDPAFLFGPPSFTDAVPTSDVEDGDEIVSPIVEKVSTDVGEKVGRA